MGLAEARLSRFFHFDCRDLNPAEKIVLEGHMHRIKAQEELARGNVPDNRVYDVVLAATGSEEQASDAYAARLAARMERSSRSGH